MVAKSKDVNWQNLVRKVMVQKGYFADDDDSHQTANVGTKIRI
jgi:hypothetical protein